MIKNLLDSDVEPKNEESPATTPSSLGLSLLDTSSDEVKSEEPYVITTAEPESLAETSRKSGLAGTAAIVLVASVVFMMVIGWLADLVLGTAPWGIVGGIIVGALIGFIQFFRFTSQIFRK